MAERKAREERELHRKQRTEEERVDEKLAAARDAYEAAMDKWRES